MNYSLLTILVLISFTDPVDIGKINRAKKEARASYTSGDYKKALLQYQYLVDSLQVKEDEVMLNLANSYFQLKDTAQASNTYLSLTQSNQTHIRSKAQQQLGILNHQQGKLEEALAHFKQAIKADANNKDARYNYEALKKKLEEQKKQEQQQKDQQQKDQPKNEKQKEEQKKEEQKKQEENQQKEKNEQQEKEKVEQKKKEQAEKEKKDKDGKEQKDDKEEEQNDKEQQEKDKQKEENAKQLSEKLKEMKISEEKAKMILEAMKNQEVQYLQQNKRKATKPKDKGKPDW